MRTQFFIRVHELNDALLVSCANVEERNELLAAEPDKFLITPHYEDYPAVLVRLSEVDRDELTETDHRLVAVEHIQAPAGRLRQEALGGVMIANGAAGARPS